MKNILLSICIQVISFVAICQESFQLENLKTFSKVYGYIRYFHPSDEASEIEWDKLAVYGAEKVEKCRTKEELLRTLNDLFLPVAPTVMFYPSGEKITFDIASVTPKEKGKFKPTFWQHYGVSLGMKNKNQPYQSVRVNRLMEFEETSPMSYGFGNLLAKLDAVPYRGKEIKYTGKVRLMEGSDGTGHLWFRVDKQNGKIGYFDNMDDRPVVKNTWNEYEISGSVDSAATNLVFGCFLKGNGELHLDDFHLFYKEDNNWIEIPLGNYGFESEDISESTKKTTWAGKGDGYKIKIISSDQSEGKKCVSIISEAKTVTKMGKKLFDKEPAIGEPIRKDIGSGLSCMIPLVLYCNDEGTYPKADKSGLESQLKNINLTDINLSLRLGDVVIAWNVFQHFYPYFDEIKTNWDKDLENALKKCYEDKNDSDFQITLQQLTAPLKDGHIWVSGKGNRDYLPPVSWEFIEDKLVITGVCSAALKIKPGDIVTEVNGMDPKKYFVVFEKRISAGTKGWMTYRANIMSLGGDKGSVLSLIINNEKIDLVRSEEYFTGPCNNDNYNASNEVKTIEPGIYYLNLDKIEMNTIDKHLDELKSAKAIICDLRGYPNSNHDFISYLLKESEKDKWMKVPQFIYPDRENLAGYDEIGWGMKPKKPHLGAKIIFITDGRAISYAESYMGYIEAYKLATIVGQPTAGTNGNVNPFDLPGSYSISWTGMKVVKHDGSQHHAVGVIPDVLVNKTIKGVAEGRDEYLEKAIELAKLK